jgi:hypothetical protein
MSPPHFRDVIYVTIWTSPLPRPKNYIRDVFMDAHYSRRNRRSSMNFHGTSRRQMRRYCHCHVTASLCAHFISHFLYYQILCHFMSFPLKIDIYIYTYVYIIYIYIYIYILSTILATKVLQHGPKRWPPTG